MTDGQEDTRPPCLVCGGSGEVELIDGTTIPCHRGCKRPEDQHHPLKPTND